MVVTRNGKPVAALVALNDEEELERLMMAHSPRLQAILERARRRIRAGKGIPADVFWKSVEEDKKTKRRSDMELCTTPPKPSAKKVKCRRSSFTNGTRRRSGTCRIRPKHLGCISMR